MRSTLKDIAREAKVSAVTVHKAIYNKSGISEHTRERILKIAKEMNYSTNTAASSLKRDQLTIAVVLPLLEPELNYFFGKVWEGVDEAERQLADFNVSIERLPCGKTWESQLAQMEGILERPDIDGVVTYCWDDTKLNPVFEQLRDKDIPVITANADALDSCRIGSVTAPNRRTGQLAAELLCNMVPDKGRIVLLGGNRMMKNLREISLGFFSYIQRHRPNLSVMELNDFSTIQYLEDELVHTLESFPDIVGVYCNSARNNLPMCRAIQRAGKDRGQLRVVASDFYAELIPYLESGVIHASMWQNQKQQVVDALQMMFHCLTSQRQQEELLQTVPIGIIMKNNYEYYL